MTGQETTPDGTDTAWRGQFRDAMMGSSPAPLLLLERGEGCYVWDGTGKKYLDFLAGIAVNSLGHAHPALVAAVSRQIATIAHASNYFATPPQIELAERLRRLTGAGDRGRVYFGNSGAEAIEAALKLARRNGQHKKILALTNSFHGRTMGALSLTGKPALREPFEPLIPGIEHIDSTITALEQAIDGSTAALIVETIKGEAGVVDLPEGYLQRARELTTRHGALLIIDEIQTGAGRTGHWFGYQEHGVVPDAVALAKGIGGGVPIGALVTFGAASDLFTVGQHGSTFGGNPLATAAANAVLEEIESAGLVGNAASRGRELRSAIAAIGSPLVTELRGSGLLIGIGLSEPIAQAISTRALELGLIINAANDSSIRLAPPLIISDREVAEFMRIFTEVLTSLTPTEAPA
jgi:acetylornithine/N-succinyldiaminopimelate aminotransferase